MRGIKDSTLNLTRYGKWQKPLELLQKPGVIESSSCPINQEYDINFSKVNGESWRWVSRRKMKSLKVVWR